MNGILRPDPVGPQNDIQGAEAFTMRQNHSQRGATQIEFILTIITIIFVMFWMWELILMTYTMNVLADAAKEGVRVAIVQGSSTTTCPDAAVTTRVQTFAAMSLQNTSGMTVAVSYPDSVSYPLAPCAANNRVRVQVTYPYLPFFKSLPVTYTLHMAAEGRIIFNRS